MTQIDCPYCRGVGKTIEITKVVDIDQSGKLFADIIEWAVDCQKCHGKGFLKEPSMKAYGLWNDVNKIKISII